MLLAVHSGSVVSNTEHDQLFRETFQHPENAAGLVKPWLPPVLAERIDWATLMLESGAFVDDASAKFADLLFSVQVRQLEGQRRPLLLQFLVEHQSTPPPRMALRMSGYVVRALERYAAAHDGAELPAVLPLVVSHCERPWSAARDLRELYALDPAADEALGPYLLGIRYLVDDLVGQTEAQIRGRALTTPAVVTLLALRSVRYESVFSEAFRRWADLLARMTPDELSPLLVYALRVGEEPTEALRDVLSSSVNLEAGDLVMTTAERLIEQGKKEGLELGRQKGRQEGEYEARRHTLVTLLGDKFPGQAIPGPVQQLIAEAPVESLAEWTRRVLTAPTLLDVFASEAEND